RFQQLETFRPKLRGELGQPGDVASRSSEAGDEPGRNKIVVTGRHNDGDCPGSLTGGVDRCPTGVDDNDINLEADQIGREIGAPLGRSLGGSALDHDVLAFYVAELAKSLLECLKEWRSGGRGTAEERDLPHLGGLLRLASNRGRERANERHEDNQ